MPQQNHEDSEGRAAKWARIGMQVAAQRLLGLEPDMSSVFITVAGGTVRSFLQPLLRA